MIFLIKIDRYLYYVSKNNACIVVIHICRCLKDLYQRMRNFPRKSSKLNCPPSKLFMKAYYSFSNKTVDNFICIRSATNISL